MLIPLPLSMARLSYGMPAVMGSECEDTKSIDAFPSTSQAPMIPPLADMRLDEKDRKMTASSGDFDTPNAAPEHAQLPSPEQDTTGVSEDDAPPPEHANGIEMAELGGPPKPRPVRPRTMSHRQSFAASLAPEECEDEPKIDEETQYFAKPGGPGVQITRLDDANDPAAFFHPAGKEPQRIVWIPQDDMGLGNELVQGNIAHHVKSSDRNATISRNVSGAVNAGPANARGISASVECHPTFLSMSLERRRRRERPCIDCHHWLSSAHMTSIPDALMPCGCSLEVVQCTRLVLLLVERLDSASNLFWPRTSLN